MKKSDLVTGMVVKMRDGSKAMVLLNTYSDGVDILSGEYWWGPLDNFNEDLLHIGESQYDIMEIYQPTCNSRFLCGDDSSISLDTNVCIWKRKLKNDDPVMLLKPFIEYLDKNDCENVTVVISKNKIQITYADGSYDVFKKSEVLDND